MRSYTVIGLGAIGGYYGARLHQAGFDVRFVARRDAEHVREHGLRIDSPEGDAVLDVDVYDDPDDGARHRRRAGGGQDHGHPTAIVPAGAPAGRGRHRSSWSCRTGWASRRRSPRPRPTPRCSGPCASCAPTRSGPGHVVHLDRGAVTLGEHRADGHGRRGHPCGRDGHGRSAGRRGDRLTGRPTWRPAAGASWCGTSRSTVCRWCSTPAPTRCWPTPPPGRWPRTLMRRGGRRRPRPAGTGSIRRSPIA